MDKNKTKSYNIKLHKFDLKTSLFENHPYFTLLILGSAGHGKTTFSKKLVNYLIYEHNCQDYKIITATRDEEYKELGLDQMIYDDATTPKFIQNFLKTYTPKKNVKSLLLMDDCSGYYRSSSEMKDTLDRIFIEHRHLKLITILIIHTLKSVAPNVRVNNDLLLITDIPDLYSLKALYDQTLPFDEKNKELIKFSDFCAFLNDNLRDYNKLLFDFYNKKWYKISGATKPTTKNEKKIK